MRRTSDRRANGSERGHLRSFAVVGALVLAAVATGHELIYLLAYGGGYDEAMQATGHGAYWTSFIVTVGATLGGLCLITARQFLRLRAQVRGAEDIEDAGLAFLLGMWLRSSAVIAPAAVLVYGIQENVETAVVAGTFPGVGVFVGDHIVAVPALLLIASFAAIVHALVRWRRDVLERRILAARRRLLPMRSLAPSRVDFTIAPVSRIASTFHGRRAPPLTPATI